MVSMKYAKDALLCLMYSAILLFFLALALLAWDSDKAVKSLPAKLDAMNATINAQITMTRQQLLSLVDRHATVVERTADERLIALQQTVDDRSGETLKLVDTHLSEITQPIVMAQANLYALAKDIQDSLDDLYPDIKSATESAAVAVTSTAQAAESVRDATPKVSASVEGIAADAKREADSLTAPKKWWQKILGPVYTVGRIIALF